MDARSTRQKPARTHRSAQHSPEPSNTPGQPRRASRQKTATSRSGTLREPRAIVAVELAPVPLVQAIWWAAPDTRTAPLAVAAEDGRILAVCPLVEAAGVAVGHGMAQAHLRCPDIALAAPDRDAALLLWERMLSTLSELSPIVEAADAEAGLAYLDARGLRRLWGEPAAVAREALRMLAIRGLAARAGSGPTRTIARALARRAPTSSHDAGEAYALASAGAGAFLDNLSIDDPALGLGPEIATALRELGVRTAAALAALPPRGLALRFGPAALAAWQCATEAEEPPLRPWSPPSVGVVTYRMEDGLDDATMLERLLVELSAQLAAQLASHGRATGVLALLLGDVRGACMTTRARYWPPLHAASSIAAAALDLLARRRPIAPVVEVTLQASDLCPLQAHQPGLWDDGAARQRRARLNAALAAHTQRHGHGRLGRLQTDPLAADGWTWEEMEEAL